jgi:hypothetical protein
MHEKNQVSYIPPERCVSRLHELTSSKQPDRLLEIESSKLVIKEKKDLEEPPCRPSKCRRHSGGPAVPSTAPSQSMPDEP